ncbi:MAG: hypothetical protein MJ229_03265 [bacterium]|nr:hypothetical protein [bacterium]
MVSGISFGQVTNVAPQGQAVAPQVIYCATPQMQADTYVSSKKKKSHPVAKLLVAAAAVLGGSALATKIPAVKKAVEKMAKDPDSAKMFDKALNGVNTLGEKVINVANKAIDKVKGIFGKSKKEIPLPPIGLPTPEQVDKTIMAEKLRTGQPILSPEELITYSRKNSKELEFFKETYMKK